MGLLDASVFGRLGWSCFGLTEAVPPGISVFLRLSSTLARQSAPATLPDTLCAILEVAQIHRASFDSQSEKAHLALERHRTKGYVPASQSSLEIDPGASDFSAWLL